MRWRRTVAISQLGPELQLRGPAQRVADPSTAVLVAPAPGAAADAAGAANAAASVRPCRHRRCMLALEMRGHRGAPPLARLRLEGSSEVAPLADQLLVVAKRREAVLEEAV